MSRQENIEAPNPHQTIRYIRYISFVFEISNDHILSAYYYYSNTHRISIDAKPGLLQMPGNRDRRASMSICCGTTLQHERSASCFGIIHTILEHIRKHNISIFNKWRDVLLLTLTGCPEQTVHAAKHECAFYFGDQRISWCTIIQCVF